MSEPVKTCLVGVEGLLGDFWLRELYNLGHHVVGVGPNHILPKKKGDMVKEYISMDLSQNCEEDLNDLFHKRNFQNLVINAGVDARPGSGKSRLVDYEIDSWKTIFEVNVFGLVKVLNSALKQESILRNVVVVGSMYSAKSPNPDNYAHYGDSGTTKHPAYSASKFAALGVVKQFASHYANHGVRINMISPGAVYSGQDEQFIEKISDKIPIARLAEPSELQGILRYLLQDNTYAIGQNFILDGGMNLW